MSYEGRGVSDHRKLDISSCCSHGQHEEINILHYWFFVNGIHRWPVRRWKLFRYFNIKTRGSFSSKLCLYFIVLMILYVTFLYATSSVQWIIDQQCVYWWPGALPPRISVATMLSHMCAFPDIFGLIPNSTSFSLNALWTHWVPLVRMQA